MSKVAASKPVGQKVKLASSKDNLLESGTSNNSEKNKQPAQQQQVNIYEPVENKSLVPFLYPYPPTPESESGGSTLNNLVVKPAEQQDKNGKSNNKKSKVKPSKAGKLFFK